jgi:hypothetical protein
MPSLAVCPAPAENIKVCYLCRKFPPEKCGHNTHIKDRKWLQEAVVWCCDWEGGLDDGQTIR